MRQVAGHSLWIGHVGDLLDVRRLMEMEIEAVVEVADNEQMAVLPRELIRCRFPLSDSGESPIWLLKYAAESVALFLHSGVSVLVCCSMGMNRSVCVAAGGISIVENKPFHEVIEGLAVSGPADISPGLYFAMQQALNMRGEQSCDRFS
jgi:hypothetical protein